jgi:orotate phosphoribosyltransferase
MSPTAPDDLLAHPAVAPLVAANPNLLRPKFRPYLARLAGRPTAPILDPDTFVTTERLVRDTRALLESLPPDLDAVVAVARSGLLPGGLVAYHRHLTLWCVSRQSGVTMPGYGVRLDGRAPASPRHVLLIDDTVAYGRELAACTPLVRAAFPGARLTRAAVYAHPRALHLVDRCAFSLDGSHYLEWNWCNAGHGEACAYDFDGILCRECRADEADDGPRYRRFLATAEPLYLPRRTPIPLVATGRHERYRAETLAWLDRHGVRVGRLEMRPWGWGPGDDWQARVGTWKAALYRRSGCRLFAESEPRQAAIIAQVSGMPVLCPAAGRIFPGVPKPRAPKDCRECHRSGIL